MWWSLLKNFVSKQLVQQKLWQSFAAILYFSRRCLKDFNESKRNWSASLRLLIYQERNRQSKKTNDMPIFHEKNSKICIFPADIWRTLCFESFHPWRTSPLLLLIWMSYIWRTSGVMVFSGGHLADICF